MTALTKEQKRFWTIIKHGYDPLAVLKTNDDVIQAINISKRLDRVIPPLAKYISKLARDYAEHANYRGYTFKTDMVSHATMFMLKSVLSFKPGHYNDIPRAYLTQVCKSSFINYIHKERKQWEIKEELKERIANGQLD